MNNLEIITQEKIEKLNKEYIDYIYMAINDKGRCEIYFHTFLLPSFFTVGHVKLISGEYRKEFHVMNKVYVLLSNSTVKVKNIIFVPAITKRNINFQKKYNDNPIIFLDERFAMTNYMQKIDFRTSVKLYKIYELC